MGPFATATEFCEYVGLTMPTDLARLQSHPGDVVFADAFVLRPGVVARRG